MAVDAAANGSLAPHWTQLTLNPKNPKPYSQSLYEPLSKLLVSPLITPIGVPYIYRYIIPLRSLDYSSYDLSEFAGLSSGV